MRADHSASQPDTSSRPRGHTEAMQTTVPADLAVLENPRLRLDTAALVALLRDPAYQPPDPIGETLDTLRRTLLSLVDGHTRRERNFGLGMRPSEPLDITELRERTHTSLTRLEGFYEGKGEGVQLTHKQRDIILQANTVLRDFLISLSDLTTDGTLNRSDTSGFLRECVALGQILGQMSLALDAARPSAGRALGNAEAPLEVLTALAQRLENVADD